MWPYGTKCLGKRAELKGECYMCCLTLWKLQTKSTLTLNDKHSSWAHDACCKGVALILDCSEHVLLFQVNAVTIDGITPLFNACCSGSVACVNMLLEFGAKPQVGNHLASPIHEAVKRGNSLWVKLTATKCARHLLLASKHLLPPQKTYTTQINVLGLLPPLMPHWLHLGVFCTVSLQLSDSSLLLHRTPRVHGSSSGSWSWHWRRRRALWDPAVCCLHVPEDRLCQEAAGTWYVQRRSWGRARVA